MVWPRISYSSGLLTLTICELPPETRRHRYGNSGSSTGLSGCRMKFARIWPCRWFTITIGMSRDRDRALAKDVPTSSEPKRPGPRVKATAVRSSGATPALRSASETTGTMFCSCAREASSGTTPPKSLWTCWEAMTLDSSTPSRRTAAEVSSQEDSMPRIISAIRFGFRLQR